MPASNKDKSNLPGVSKQKGKMIHFGERLTAQEKLAMTIEEATRNLTPKEHQERDVLI